jgi:hypothetical protein
MKVYVGFDEPHFRKVIKGMVKDLRNKRSHVEHPI